MGLVEAKHCEQRRGMRLKLVGQLQGTERLEKCAPIGESEVVMFYVIKHSHNPHIAHAAH